jgi:hypothetical protein
LFGDPKKPVEILDGEQQSEASSVDFLPIIGPGAGSERDHSNVGRTRFVSAYSNQTKSEIFLIYSFILSDGASTVLQNPFLGQGIIGRSIGRGLIDLSPSFKQKSPDSEPIK